MTQIWVLYRQSGSDRLEKQPTDLRQCTCYFGDRTLDAAYSLARWIVGRDQDAQDIVQKPMLAR